METAIALLTGGGLAALGGLASGLIANWLGRRRDERRYDHEAKQTERRHEHERRLAHEARRQDRITKAYDDVMALASRVALWAAFTRQMYEPAGSPKPELPTVEEQAHVQALLSIHGSQRVRDHYESWKRVVNELNEADYTLRTVERTEAKGRSSGVDSADIWRKIGMEIKPREVRLREELATAIAEELDRR